MVDYIENGSLTIEEYNDLRNNVGWSAIQEKRVEQTLKNNYYRIIVRNENKELIGMARLVNDGGYYFSLIDVVVKKEYQHLGIGTKMLSYVQDKITEEAKTNGPIFLSLIATKGMASFYKKIGLEICREAGYGEGMAMWVRSDV